MEKKKSVLIVENDLVTARAYQKLLEEAGYEVGCALDGEEGLKRVHDGYHCVVLEPALSKIDGWQVLERLKNHDGTRHIPVVVCTVLDGKEVREKAKKNGADGFVSKFSRDEILAEIGKVLGGAARGNLH